MADVRVRFPLGALDFRVWGSLASRVFRKHEIVGSNPTILTDLMRWVPCWYGRAAVNRFVAGSIPATTATSIVRQTAAITGKSSDDEPLL